MDITFKHMYLMTGVRLEFTDSPPDGLDITISANTPTGELRQLYKYNDTTDYPSVCQISDLTVYIQL